jgi:hypothetical protein
MWFRKRGLKMLRAVSWFRKRGDEKCCGWWRRLPYMVGSSEYNE